jgi:protein-tyrosine-phosphatase
MYCARVTFLQLVADPQRWQLLSHLSESDRRVGELARLTGEAQNLVSYHLGELRSAGLVTSRRSSADGRDTYYRLDLDRYAELFADAASALHPAVRLAPAVSDEASPRPRTSRPPKPVRVLFLCTGNSARSQMAEAMLEHRLGARVDVVSAGSQPKELHPLAVRALVDFGIDIAGRETKSFDQFTRRRFDRVITMCDKVREVCPEFPGDPRYAHWSMPDPSVDGTYEAFARTAADIDSRVTQLVAQLNEEAANAKR